MLRKIVFALGLLVVAACTPDTTADISASPPQDAGAVAGAVPGGVAATNTFRAQASVAPLRQNAVLAQVAAIHAADLVATGGLSHTGSDGSSVGDRARRAGYNYCFVAENIARTQDSLDEVISGWMFSPGHRANMLNPQASEMALVRQGDLWVMVLGRNGC